MSKIFSKQPLLHQFKRPHQLAHREKAQTLLTVLNSMDELVFVLDYAGKIRSFPQLNKGNDLFRPPSDFLGKRIDQLGLPDDVQAGFIKKLSLVRETNTPQTYHYELPTPQGNKPFEARLSCRYNKFSQLIGFTVIVRDISERKEAEERLQACGLRYQTLVENMPAMVCRFDPDGYLTFTNNHFSSSYNRTDNFFQQLPPEVRLDFASKLHSLSPNNQTTLIEYGAVDDNGSIRWFRWRITALFSPEGELQEFQGFGEDVTEDKNRTIQQEQLGRLQTGRRLAQVMTHEVNNALTGIFGYLNFALEGAQATGVQALIDDIKEVQSSADRVRKLAEQLASIYKPNGHSPVVTKPAELTRKSVESFFYDIDKRTHQLIWREEETPPALIDITQFNQVLDIIFRNALEAMPGGGEIEVSVKSELFTQPVASSFAMIPPGEYTRISVTDHGVGIEPQKIPLIFDPTYTTKNRVGTSGLSLAKLQSIIEKHNAFIKVESVVGKGTTFSLFFPATNETEKLSFPPVSQRRPGPVNVLVVDDEFTIRDIVERVLANQGHRVTVAQNAEEALGLLANNGPFQLVITDINMGPGLSGIELAQQINQHYAGTRIAVMSGNHEEIGKAETLASINGSIKKPFPNEKVVSLLEKALGD